MEHHRRHTAQMSKRSHKSHAVAKHHRARHSRLIAKR
jgi:hypothetical protein